LGVARGGDGRIYAIGGWGNDFPPALRIVEAYSPATDSWTKAAPLPSRRAYVSAATSRSGLIYLIGGCEWNPDGNCRGTRRVDVFSPKENRWWTLPPTLVVHESGAAAAGRHRIFVISGFDTAAVESRPSFCFACQLR
jgi:hypothetical protein